MNFLKERYSAFQLLPKSLDQDGCSSTCLLPQAVQGTRALRGSWSRPDKKWSKVAVCILEAVFVTHQVSSACRAVRDAPTKSLSRSKRRQTC